MNAPYYPTETVILPPELEKHLEESVRSFKENWGSFLSFAESKGYITNYSREIRRIAVEAYLMGVKKANER